MQSLEQKCNRLEQEGKQIFNSKISFIPLAKPKKINPIFLL